MKCPHCLVEIHSNPATINLRPDIDGYWQLLTSDCPACKRLIIELRVCEVKEAIHANGAIQKTPGVKISGYLVYPKSISRNIPALEVPSKYSSEYMEASMILTASPKASAALSRRCLQALLRDIAGANQKDLSKQIDFILENGRLPTHLATSIDAVRVIGNFAAHPIKSQSTGEIIEVEPGEAEWTLDVLDGLFDYYFVQPEMIRKKKEAMNEKLEAAGKPPMK